MPRRPVALSTSTAHVLMGCPIGTRVRRIENAVVLTMNRQRGVAASIDVSHGSIVGVDQPDDGRGAGEVLDLRGTLVIPGFIDSHLHLLAGGRALDALDLSEVRSRAEFERRVAERHALLPTDAWLEGGGWSEVNWTTSASRSETADATHAGKIRDAHDHDLPDRHWLRGCGERPAILYRMDHHVCVVNDALLAILARRGLLERDPPGGRIERDASGRPTGMLVEAAAWMTKAVVPEPTVAQRSAALRAAGAHLLARGVTTVGTMEYARDVHEVLLDHRRDDLPRMLVTLLDREWPVDVGLARSVPRDDRLRVVGMKAFLDGTFGSRTAAMLDPYEDDPGNRGLFVEFALDDEPSIGDRTGESVGSVGSAESAESARSAGAIPRAERLHAWARAVVDAGLSPSMHAIGDAALRLALDVVDVLPHSAAVRIEHAQTVAPEDLPRTRGRWLSMQPLHKADDGRVAERRLGSRRLDRFFPFRSLLDHGAKLAFGSDWPIVSPDPLHGLRAAVLGRSLDGDVMAPEQNLTPTEALAAYTIDAATMFSEFGEPRLGVLRPGGMADLVVLSGPLDDESTRVLCTIVSGVVRHVAKATEAAGAA